MTDLLREDAVFVGGRWVPATGAEVEVENPATEQATGVVRHAGVEQVDAAVQTAREAFDGWWHTPVTERVAVLRRLHEIVTARADRFADLVHREQGSPPPVARGLHVDVPLRVIAATADALEQFTFRSEIGNSTVLREPVGVVAAITPWNLPLHQVVVKIVPALAAGCTVVLKPAELTPLTAYELVRALQEAGLPDGVLALLPGSGAEIGAELVRHPDVDQVSFTGSTAVGAQVAAAAALAVKRCTLELGGKSASVVLSDADDALLAKAVKVTVANCFLNGGQTCTALSRLVVPAGRLEQVEDLARAAAAKYVPGARLGPLISARQAADVRSFLQPEAWGGGRLVTEPAPVPERGHYVPPAVVSDVDPDSRLAQEEVFGPVLAVLPAEDDAHAVALANRSRYGLGGAVWSGSEEAALEAAGRIRTGQVDINGAAFNPAAPFGGYRQSGIGREIGAHGIADVLETKAVQR